METLVNLLPDIIETGSEVLEALIDGITEAIPLLVDMLPEIIETTIKVLTDNLPKIIEAGIQILVALIEGITKAIPELIKMLPEIITTIVSTLTDALPQILEMGLKILGELISGIGQAIPELIKAGAEIVATIMETLGELPEDRAFHELVRTPSLIKDDFIIKKEEIIPFLSSLEEASGGKGTFRFLHATTPTIKDRKWDLKFLNLYLNPIGEGFIVCNRISRAIRYKDIIPNIDKSTLGWYNSKKE